MGRVVGREEARSLCDAQRQSGHRIVFTNGCFDLLHHGHAMALVAARGLGDFLVVGVNDDASVRRLKGLDRPFVPLEHRAGLLAALHSVDLVVPYAEDTPLATIEALRPDVLVKGKDYREEDVVGAKEVRSWGGDVRLVELVDGISSTEIASRIRRDP